jgi:diguanylate cyclase (GGDEF)-like protein/PAS domain S-box-containing protein
MPLKAVLALLDQVSASPSDDATTILSLIAVRAHQMTAATGAIIGVRDRDHMVLRSAVGSAASLQGRRVPLDRSLSGLALSTGQSLICVDTLCERRADPARFEGTDMRSLAVEPFHSPTAGSGVLIVTSPFAGTFGKEQQETLQVLARVLMRRLELVDQLAGYQLLLTENDIALATLRESESRFRSAFDHSGIGTALMTTDGRWLKVNPALCRTLGYSRQELLALDHQGTTHPEDVGLETRVLRRIMAGERTRYELEKRYIHKDRSIIWGLLTVTVVATPEQQALYLIAQIQDITARKATEETLRGLAVRDDLTGVWNRREMFRLLNEETSRADRHSRALSLIMLDIDAFKRVNDTYGHQAGDASLRQIARIIEECVRSFDRVARYGGEEFAVILPETAGADAMIVAERIRARVAGQEFVIGQKDGVDVRIPLTVSSGIATTIGGKETSIEEMIREADASLYVAKNGGRNRCVAAASALVDWVRRRDDGVEQTDCSPV